MIKSNSDIFGEYNRLPRKSGDFLAMTFYRLRVAFSHDSKRRSAGKACNSNLIHARKSVEKAFISSFLFRFFFFDKKEEKMKDYLVIKVKNNLKKYF